MQREVAAFPFTSHVSIHQETSRCVSPDIVLSSLHEILRSSLRTPSPLHFRHQTSIKKEPEAAEGFRDRGLIVSPFTVQQEQEGLDANKLPSIAEWIAKNESSNNCQETSPPHPIPAAHVQPKTTSTEIRENTNIDTSIKRPQFVRPEFRHNPSFLDNSAQQLLNATLSNPPTPSSLVNAKSNTASRAEEMRKSIVPSHNSAFSSIGREPGNIFGTAFIPQVSAPSTPSQQQPRSSLISPQRGPLAPEITQQRTTTTTTTLAFGVVQPRSRPAPSAPFVSQAPVNTNSGFGSTLSESKNFFHPNTSASASTASTHSPTMEGTMNSSSSSVTAAALSLTSFSSAQDKFFHPSRINGRGIKRKRTTSDQLDVLENAFAEDPLPSKRTKERLAEETGLSLKRIQIWFQNRRAKQKKSGETPSKKQHTEESN